jgi:hypothetical protein
MKFPTWFDEVQLHKNVIKRKSKNVDLYDGLSVFFVVHGYKIKQP